MGWWHHGADGSSLHEAPTGLMWGDGPADAVYWLMFGSGKRAAKRARQFHRREAEAVRRISGHFRAAYGREPTKQEMVSGVLFEFGGVRRAIRSLPDFLDPAPATGPQAVAALWLAAWNQVVGKWHAAINEQLGSHPEEPSGE